MTLTTPDDTIVFRLQHNEMTCEVTYCGHPNCVALMSYYLEMDEAHGGGSLRSPLPRTHPANRCERCGKLPTAANATTIYPGQPADLENGPHPNDLPTTICELCEEWDSKTHEGF